MTNTEWFKEASPNTILENIKDPTSAQKAYVRKITYEVSGCPNNIINQGNLIALIVKEAIDDDKVLRLNWIHAAVEKTWNKAYPDKKLDESIWHYAYLVVCHALVRYFM